MTDRLDNLKNLAAPAPSEAARRRALAAALLAYDADERDARQASVRGSRLTSIVNAFKRVFDMDIRVPVAAGALGLILLPLALQLNSTTSLTPLPPPAETLPQISSLPLEDGRARDALTAPATGEVRHELSLDEAESGKLAAGNAASGQPGIAATPAPMAEPSVSFRAPADAAMSPMLTVAEEQRAYVPESQAGDRFEGFDDNGVVDVLQQPVSTFSIDVDTASYAYVRRALSDGYLPPADAVRVEEVINYFSYDYPVPDSAAEPFRATVAVYPTPWNPNTRLLQIGIKGYTPPAIADTPSNLVLLIDTSGSMDEPDKLPLLKRAFALLVDTLDASDTVSIVTYAGSAGTVLMPTSGADKATILAALDNLTPGGSTAGAAGIEEAYRLAERSMTEGGVNRVILATDGDFNVGISSPEELEDFIARKRDEGISLSVLGFGTGNYYDALMQSLAQNGNGNAAYIDSFAEARKVLVEEAGATLVTIASDVKIQVEFNPARIAEYRLIGYETRALAREDFNNDRVDAGEVGAGHEVTAIYEITPVGAPAQGSDPLRYGVEAPAVVMETAGAELAFVKLRYKLPGETQSRLMERPVTEADVIPSLEAAPDDMQFAAAVAAFGQNLRGGRYAGAMSYAEIADLAREGRGADREGWRAQFISLVELADSLSGSGAR
jgi:Ca-activated chloride channel family protein